MKKPPCILSRGSQPIRLQLARLWKCFPVMCAQYASDCGCAVSRWKYSTIGLRSPNIKPGFEKVLLRQQNPSHLLQVSYRNDRWVERHYLYHSFIPERGSV